MTLPQVLEALLFASPKPLSLPEINAALRAAAEKTAEPGLERDLASAEEPLLRETLGEMAARIQGEQRGYLLVEQANGWTLVTHPDAAAWVRRLYPEAKPTRLSGPALETLAIIAYRQPVTRADIEAVRGVAVDGVMQVLLDRGLVRISGRAEVPGRPLLYTTTEFFLQHFGLKTTEELPNASELKRIPLPSAAAPPVEAAAPAPEPFLAPEEPVVTAETESTPGPEENAVEPDSTASGEPEIPPAS